MHMPDYVNQNDESQVTHGSMGALISFTFDELCDSSDTETGTRGGARILPASRALRILALVINFIGTRRGRRGRWPS